MTHQPIEEGGNGDFRFRRPLNWVYRGGSRRESLVGRWADGCRLRLFIDGAFFVLFCRSLTETMSELVWGEGDWKAYGKDLETALQSQEARSCSEWGFLLRMLSGRLSPLFDRLYLYDNQLASIPDCIGHLTNLTVYDIQFGIWVQFSSLSFHSLFIDENQLTSIPDTIGQLTNLTRYDIQSLIWFQFSSFSLIGLISARTNWRHYRNLSDSWEIWLGTTFSLLFDFNSHRFLW